MLINNIVDIHAHIIPGVDDGAKNTMESIKLLKDLKMQGVGCVYATPHFYRPKQSFEEYFENVDKAWAELLEATKGKGLPELRRGYEIHAFRGMSTCENLKKMCLENSHYILIELPYNCAIDNWVANELYNIQFTLGLKPIIAHIERYFGYAGFDKVMELVYDEDVRTQITSSALNIGYNIRKKILKLINSGHIHFIASDAHSMTARRGMFAKANEIIAKKCGKETLLKLYARSREMMGC